MFFEGAICFHNSTCIAVVRRAEIILIGVLMYPVNGIIRMDEQVSTDKLDDILRLKTEKKALRTQKYNQFF